MAYVTVLVQMFFFFTAGPSGSQRAFISPRWRGETALSLRHKVCHPITTEIGPFRPPTPGWDRGVGPIPDYRDGIRLNVYQPRTRDLDHPVGHLGSESRSTCHSASELRTFPVGIVSLRPL